MDTHVGFDVQGWFEGGNGAHELFAALTAVNTSKVNLAEIWSRRYFNSPELGPEQMFIGRKT